MRHFSPADNGNYYAEPHELIGHEACDVTAWVEAHPDYDGSIEFERWDFEGSVDVTEVFMGEADEDEAVDVRRAAA